MIDQILFDLSSMPNTLSSGMCTSLCLRIYSIGCFLALESDDSDRLRLAIEETLSRLTSAATSEQNMVSIHPVSTAIIFEFRLARARIFGSKFDIT